ncbi:MAG: GIY-YIG nuclease family protein [Alphaproteobacteria bacterium]|nr:MAG: GIY-YIG nuclease family protein [Alphaproteobacteria bacterium]
MKSFFVYMVTNRKHGTLYIGVTSNLPKRIHEHRSNAVEGFTKQYSLHRLVYFEKLDDAENAILREKRIKEWKRAWKVQLIEKENPEWNDLFPTLNR